VTDEGRGLLLVAALLVGIGFVGGRMTAPVPPVEVRCVTIDVPSAVPVPPVAVAPIDPVPPAEPINAPATIDAPDDVAPLPTPRPKVEAKPKPKPEKAGAKKPRAAVNRQRKPTARECDLMRKSDRSTAKAWSSYSAAQIDQAFRDCGL